jgi:DNA mismatch endonuclease (patch repair protein)
VAQLGSALDWGSRGRRFKSCQPDHVKRRVPPFFTCHRHCVLHCRGLYSGPMRDPKASSETARRVMQGNKGRDTKPELRVRRLVHALGLRYQVNARPEPELRRTADLLFRREKVAIMIDGCYWHGCPMHFSAPKSNSRFWLDKIERNRVRDRDTTKRFEQTGWLVLRFWEHETPSLAAEEISRTVISRRN